MLLLGLTTRGTVPHMRRTVEQHDSTVQQHYRVRCGRQSTRQPCSIIGSNNERALAQPRHATEDRWSSRHVPEQRAKSNNASAPFRRLLDSSPPVTTSWGSTALTQQVAVPSGVTTVGAFAAHCDAEFLASLDEYALGLRKP